MKEKSFIESSWTKQDETFEMPLRPQTLDQFIGQKDIKERLKIFIGAAQKRCEPLSHMLLCGSPGLGKTTLANIIAKTVNSNIIITAGPVIEKPKDLAGILTNLKKGDILFIDEIHRLPSCIEEYLYPAMEDFTLDLLIDTGPNARTVQLKLNQFTLIGATTRIGLLSGPMRSRFVFNARLNYYNTQDLQSIILRSASILNLNIDEKGTKALAKRARGTPRIANNLLKWVRDFAQMQSLEIIKKNKCIEALNMLAIDEIGLDEMDKKILNVIIDHYNGGPVGVQTISVAVGEEAHTLEEVYEPYLIKQGFLKRTPRGREVTNLAYSHLKKTCPSREKKNENN